MLKRLLRPWEKSVFQLYPRPREKTQADRIKVKRERQKIKSGRWEVLTTPHHVYSGNRQWRCRYIDGRWEKRVGRNHWKLVPNRDLYRIRKAIIRDIEPLIQLRRDLTERLGGSDTAPVGFDTAPDDLPIPCCLASGMGWSHP